MHSRWIPHGATKEQVTDSFRGDYGGIADKMKKQLADQCHNPKAEFEGWYTVKLSEVFAGFNPQIILFWMSKQ
jgi:hypothetical protein